MRDAESSGHIVDVRFPELRGRLREAVDELCDEELQERLWVRGERRSSCEHGFEDAILVVVDEFEAFRGDLIGEVLFDSAEEEAFEGLAAALETLIDAIGKRGSFADARSSAGIWTSCVAKALELQRRLDRR